MSVDLTQFYQIFFDEAAEHLAAMETMLLALDVANPSMDDLNAIFRAAHSIKGGSGTFGFNDMTEVTHVLETLLDKLRKQEMTLTDEMITAFLHAGDVISMQLAAHRGEGEVDQAEVKTVCAALEHLSSAQDSAPSPLVVSTTSAAAPQQDDSFGFFDDPAPVTESPAADDTGYGFFHEITPVAAAPTILTAEVSPPVTPNAGRRTLDATADVVKTGRRAVDKPGAAPDSSIRVSVEKVDQLINLAGELVITQAMLTQSAQEVMNGGSESLQRGLYQLERNTRDLQEAVMSIRMMPMSFVFSRFPRLVRDLAGKLNKQVELKTVGEHTELDKGLIEKISDPLTHLVRNSLDHGIETPEKRTAAGKDPLGTITLKASHQGGNVVIEVADDGGGLNRDKILNKAREKGLPVRDGISDQEVWALIMEPGFSTAEVVTDVSGRGVGMDVVKRNITEIGGRVEMESEEGFGTRIIIRLPLTLAILDGLSLSVGRETYIVPLNAIIESLQVKEADLKTVSGEGRLLRVRGEYLPLVALHEVFNVKPVADGLEKGIAVIVDAEGKKTALFVDELLGQHQVVIKSLESNFRKVQGVSGATIMGDGKVALILDVAALVTYAQRERVVEV